MGNKSGTSDVPFFMESSQKACLEYQKKSSDSLVDEGFQNALQLFHEAAKRVPAYKDFLTKQHINPTLIKTRSDFLSVPVMTKQNYLRQYPLEALSWDGRLSGLSILSSSSGSTGEPFLWPRGEVQEQEGGFNFEVIMKEFFGADKKKTLYVISFAMGTWISGTFVLACAEQLTKKGYPVLSVTPGIDMDTTFVLLKKLAPSFDQIIISGYPPFVKDMIDLGKTYGIDWKKLDVKFLFAAEGFTEAWRTYIHDKVGSKDALLTSCNIYGSADAAILAHETPLSIAIRQKIGDNPSLLSSLFGDTRMPTLAQYDPRLKYFEEVEGSVIFTTNAGLPLVRYSIGDNGSVITYDEMNDRLAKVDISLSEVLPKTHKRFDWHLPFVTVYGRSDFTVSLYGLLIYPEHIKHGLEHKSLRDKLTGKFVMEIGYDDEQNPYLLIRVELAPHRQSSKTLMQQTAKAIHSGLLEINSEYSRLYQSIEDKAYPVIELIENNHPEYFRRGTKQRWVKKS